MEPLGVSRRWGIDEALRARIGNTLQYAYMRARTRAVVASTTAALVVVPLTGFAAVALVGNGPVTPTSEAVAENGFTVSFHEWLLPR